MEELLRDSKIILRQIEKLKTIINIKSLLVKMILILSICYIVFTYCFGVLRMHGISMVPSISDGDLVIFYRLDKSFYTGDIIVFKTNENKTRVLRIVATEGQTVDINGSGELMINNHVEEEQSYFKTEEVKDSSIKFPYVVEQGKLFVIGDYRVDSQDSRIFGAIDKKDVKGKVLSILRIRDV
jgi:signal peptidase I